MRIVPCCDALRIDINLAREQPGDGIVFDASMSFCWYKDHKLVAWEMSFCPYCGKPLQLTTDRKMIKRS